MRRLLWLAVLASAFPALVVAAEDGSNLVTETVFVPPVSYVGDLVEARLTLLLPEGKTILPPLSLPVQSWVLIRDVQVRHDPPFERVTVKYVPFAPGVKTLPALVLGDITLEGVHISTSSLLAKDAATDLAPPREQMLLPHTEIAVFLAFLVLIVLPLLVWRFLKPLIHLVHLWSHRTQRHRAWRQLLKDLKRLRSRALSLKGPEFYSEFSRLARTYLSGRMGEDFGTLTANEVREALQTLPPAWSAEWVRLVHRADVVRFDAQEPPEQEKLDDLASLHRESGRLEGKEVPSADL